METLRDLPNIEALEDAGLLSKQGGSVDTDPAIGDDMLED